MPRSPQQLEQIREESRERILDTALRLFAEHGYAATSVRMIAEAAGIAQGLLYNYYAGKEALLRAIVERSMADVQESFERAAAGATARERLERLIREAFAIVRQHLAFWRLSYQVRMQPAVLEGLAGAMPELAEGIRLQLEELLRAAGAPSPAVAARVLFAAIDGAAQHFALDPDRYPLDGVADLLIADVLPGLAGSHGTPEEES